VALLFGCSDGERQQEPEQEEAHLERLDLVDQTALCLQSATDGGVSLQAIGTQCFSSSCTTVIRTSCSFEQLDRTITVHSSIEVDRLRGSDIICTSDCLRITADCDPLSSMPGEYTFLHGAASASVALPTERAVLFDYGDNGEAWCGDPVGESAIP
jgi:hypothetical protein